MDIEFRKLNLIEQKKLLMCESSHQGSMDHQQKASSYNLLYNNYLKKIALHLFLYRGYHQNLKIYIYPKMMSFLTEKNNNNN
jgi:hypothetical protein